MARKPLRESVHAAARNVNEAIYLVVKGRFHYVARADNIPLDVIRPVAAPSVRNCRHMETDVATVHGGQNGPLVKDIIVGIIRDVKIHHVYTDRLEVL